MDQSSRHEAAYINKLPEDLIEQIFDYVIEDYTSQPQIDLLKVNRLFNRIAKSVVYRQPLGIAFHCCFHDLMTKTERLHRTFTENPTLTHYCHKISIRLTDDKDDEASANTSPIIASAFEGIQKLLSILTRVTDLSIRYGFKSYTEETWSLVRTALDNMPGLNALFISPWAVLSPDIIHDMSTRSSSIRELYLDDIIHDEQEPYDAPILKQRGTITKLDIGTYWGTFEELIQLINWPQKLQHFSLTRLFHKHEEINLDMLGNALMIHKGTLETLDIPYVKDPESEYPWSLEERMIDFTPFSNLRKLALSRWSLSSTKPLSFSEQVGRKILAPKLESFTWDFNLDYHLGHHWQHLGPREAHWIRCLGDLAADLNLPLRSIYIEFRPEFIDVRRGSLYPWHFLDVVAEHLATRNIQLKYSTPEINLATWTLLKRYNEYQLSNDGSRTTFFKLDDSDQRICYDTFHQQQSEASDEEVVENELIEGRGGRRRRLAPAKTAKTMTRTKHIAKGKKTRKRKMKHERWEILTALSE